MKGKPVLVAIAAFFIVLIGGAAMAGIGYQLDSGEKEAATYEAPKHEVTDTTKAPKATTTTTVKVKDPEPAPEKHAPEPKKEEEKKTEEPVKEEKPVEVFTLDYPADGSHVKSKVVTFGGTASDDVVVHRGKYEAKPHDGKWSMDLVVSPGKNRVAFEAINAAGETTVAKVTVYYDAPVEEPKEEEPKEEEKSVFSAHQKYGSCGEEIPYDVFYGTAKPGTKIEAWSEFGSGSTTANEHGKWEMKVKFPTAPAGATFKVKIKASTGEYQKFHFTNTGGEKDDSKDH